MHKTTTFPLSSSDRATPMGTWIAGGVLGLIVLSTAAMVARTVINAPQIRAAHAAEQAIAIDEENRSVCGRFGAGPQTSRFAECAAALADVRARHEERNAPPPF